MNTWPAIALCRRTCCVLWEEASGHWVNVSTSFMEYNANDNLVKKDMMSWETDKWSWRTACITTTICPPPCRKKKAAS
ncbi:MAG: hypothetical protein JNL13_06415 [Chitinophagaceae bacterium]|nr:hypothetical protein [Chitinophagaceae bacterium]